MDDEEKKESGLKKFAGVLGLVMSLVTLIGLVFQAGVSYSKMSGTDSRIENLTNEVRVLRENLLRKGLLDPVEAQLPQTMNVNSAVPPERRVVPPVIPQRGKLPDVP